MSINELIKECSNYLSEELLLHPIEFKITDAVKDNYVDNGRSDIYTEAFKKPFMYEDKKLIGYTVIDKYLYGRENQTSKKYTLTIYHQ